MEQKRVRNLPWRNDGTTIAGKQIEKWSQVVGGCGGSGCSGESARARERETRNGGGSLAWWLHWPEMVDGGRRVW